jgi:predicted acetyltransferase
MTTSAEPVEVTPASLDEQPILANLIQLYAHDFSEFHDVEFGADGRFVYKSLPLYWLESGRHPFLVRVGGKLAGFVLAQRGSQVSVQPGSQVSADPVVWDMAEFFILRGFRRLRVGTNVALNVWRQLPGRWEIRVMESNQPALRFWERATAAFTGESLQPVSFDKDGEAWRVFIFDV